MATRYAVQWGQGFAAEGVMHLSGPQNAEQIPQELHQLFERDSNITSVIVVHKDRNTDSNPRDGYYCRICRLEGE